MRKVCTLLAFSVALWLPVFAQGPASAAARKIDNEFVQQEFGKEFTFMPQVGVAYGDLDGDGVEDVVIAARCTTPMLGQGEHNYTVIDPFNEFFGYGDPRMTTTFSAGDPALRGLVMLLIQGAGPDAWRSATPKSKFVIVNLPYRTISVR